MRWKLRLLSGLVLVGLLLSMTTAAWAEEPAEEVGLRGQVVAIEGDALLVKTASGEECRVITDEGTSFRIPGVSSPTIADIDEGDYVGVRGQRNEDGDVLAMSVVVVPAEYAHRRHIVRGEVLAIEEQTLTVRTPQGERLVITDEGTRFLIPGIEEPDAEDISVGDPILALGRPDEEGDDTFGLATRGRVVRVQTTEETVFRIPAVEDPGLDDLNARDLVVVVGSWHMANEACTARTVALIPRWPSHLRFVRGEVTGIEGRTIVLDALQGEVAVQTDGETIYRIPGVEDPGLDDLEIGDKVAMLVTGTEEGALLARVIVVRRGESALIDVVAGPVEAAAAIVNSLPWAQSEPLEAAER
jgi:RNase P/RNase MRP subunit p29